MNFLTSLVTALVFTLCLFSVKPASAQSVRETTYVKRDGPTIMVRTIGPVEVVKVEPYIDAKKGKKSGRLNLQVVIKNTAHEPRSYQVFGQGKTETGGWLGGSTKAPSKGRLDPGKEATTKIQTRFEGESVPEEIRLDVF
jgi:hypothetical protein